MTYLLQVSTCWIIFYGIYMLFLQKETFFSINRYYLLGALFAGLIIPLLGGYLPANQTSIEIYQVMSNVTAVEIIAQETQSSTNLTWLNFLYLVYSIGALIVLSKFVYGLSKIYNIYRYSSITKHQKYTLVESSKFHLPFSFFHFIFISKELPLNKDVEKVLKHEELHAYQWHSLDIVIAEILQIFFWFNPILIFYKNALRQSHEFLADAYVTKDFNRSSYGQLLLRQSTSGLEIALANHFFHSQIKKRITMMYKEKSKRPAMVKYLLALPVLIGLLILFASSKMNNESKVNFDDDCLSVKIVDHNKYETGGNPLTLSKFEAIINSDTPPKCIDINYNHSSYINSISPIIRAATFAKISVQLRDAEISDEMIRSVMGEKWKDNQIPENFNGRKIIQRISPEELNIPKSLSGTITIKAEANKEGDIIYAEIYNEKSTIEDKEVLKQALSVAKKYKIEPAKEKAIGTITLNLTSGNGDPIFKVVEEMPRFPGCEEDNLSLLEKDNCAKQKMLNFIYKNIKYPAEAKKAEIEGMIVIQFVVEKDGKISNAKIVREIGGECGSESLRVVNSMPTWIPGKQKGEAVRVQYTLPVKFKLESKDKSSEQNDVIPKITAFGKKSEKAIKENLSIPPPPPPQIDNGEEPYRVVEEMPRFLGCENAKMTIREKDECGKKKMLEFIYSNIKYPKEARQKGIEGMAVVQMIIEKDGSVTSSKVVRDPGAGTGAEAKRVVDLMPIWTPGKQQGKLVRVQYTLPVKFKLEGDEKETTKEVDQIPFFPETTTEQESINGLLNFVFKNVTYPEEAIQNSIEGMALVKFTINSEGRIQKIELSKSLGWGIDEAVLEMMDKIQKLETPWTPAILDNKNVNYEYVLPVKFKLEDHHIEKIKSRKLELNDLKISPNPSNGIFNLAFDLKDKTPADIIFYSMEGKILKTIDRVNVPYAETIDLSLFKGQTVYISINQKDKVHTLKTILQ